MKQSPVADCPEQSGATDWIRQSADCRLFETVGDWHFATGWDFPAWWACPFTMEKAWRAARISEPRTELHTVQSIAKHFESETPLYSPWTLVNSQINTANPLTSKPLTSVHLS